ncbi:Maf family protein [Candidatus Cryosericum septentrionale]|uniref:dTTP/UTP pyrophosphatase n=1 Tax=Candidatus Cryosericum septentrionale TaxID=2290913 RepID=A0A398DML9_9BACT|nr:nucleoside triphosphate pyrophosphatase [Candidatus Cryosericum septentrionale]RIE16832.1 septum formation protein Maf [Candidatus Cryosericum septentrionale]
MKLYLASSSPRRAHMLADWGIPFSTVKADVDEVMLDAAPENCAAQNALAKAISGSHHVDAGLVVGVDTVVTCDGRILGKPLDEAQAREMLASLEGREHRVITAMAAVLMPEKTAAARISITRVFMRRLSEHERQAYLSNPEYRDKAGAYAVQGLAASFIERTDGPMDTIIGFTMSDFYALCTELHADVRR